MTHGGMSASQPVATVIILNHNGADILGLVAQSMRAIRDSAGLPDAQLIVVDDNSSDGSDAEAAALCAQLGAEFASTRYGKHGIGAARNLGLSLARGPLIAFLDNDAIPQPGWLSALVGFVNARPSAGAVASRVMFADKHDVVNSMGSVLNELFHGNGVGIHELFEFARLPDKVMYATGNGMALRRAALDQIGTFDEGYLFWGADDADLGMRLRRAGWTIHVVPDAVVHHLHSYSKTVQGMPFWDGRNRIRMALKHLSWQEIPRFVLVDLAANLRSTPLRHYLRCWWSTLADAEGMRTLYAYRRRHRGELGYWRAFAEWFQAPRRLLVTPDNRPYGLAKATLTSLRIGENDEAHLYHGWYWVERVGPHRARRARQVASLVGSLPQGASALRLCLLPGPEPVSSLTVRARWWHADRWEEVATLSCALQANDGDGLVYSSLPCDLPPGEYHIILEADSAPLEKGFFPRQISFGLASLSVESHLAEAS